MRSAKGVLCGRINCLDLKSANPSEDMVSFSDCMIVHASNLSEMLGLCIAAEAASQWLILLMSRKKNDKNITFDFDIHALDPTV
jgi:hypothetical protein